VSSCVSQARRLSVADAAHVLAAGRTRRIDAGRVTCAGPGGTSNGTAQQIEEWVAANYTATTVGGVTVYDLS